MRRRAESTYEARSSGASSSGSSISPSVTASSAPLAIYSHVSTYRSLQLELQLYSPSLKINEGGHRGPLAVYSEHDHVSGKVIIDSNSYHSGCLTISVEGSFTYQPADTNTEDPEKTASSSEPRKHIFLTCSSVIPVSPSLESSPRSAFRDAFIRRRPSASAINISTISSDRSHSFSFNLPQSLRSGEELPASFLSLDESFVIAYKVIASWEPSGAFENSSYLEVPIVVQPDSDFQSLDASYLNPDSWLEMPLKADRPMPFRCAFTLPTSVTFSRSSSIPYFVVFTTTPRSSSLAKEIAADATISVSLVRQITITEQVPLPPTPPQSPSSDDSDAPSRTNLLKRVARTAQTRVPGARRTSDATSTIHEKPLPPLPMQKVFSDTSCLQNQMCIGFPKRPRQHCDPSSHPSLELQNLLPDGLHKSKIPLDKEMLPSIDWAGTSVKYYLDISVLIGQDELRAKFPIRIL